MFAAAHRVIPSAADSQAVFLAAKYAVGEAVHACTGTEPPLGVTAATVKVSVSSNASGRLKTTGEQAVVQRTACLRDTPTSTNRQQFALDAWLQTRSIVNVVTG